MFDTWQFVISITLIPLILSALISKLISRNADRRQDLVLISFVTLLLAIALFLPLWLDRKTPNSYQFLSFLLFGLPVSGICMGIDLTVGIQAYRAREYKLLIGAAANFAFVIPLVIYYLFYVALA